MDQPPSASNPSQPTPAPPPPPPARSGSQAFALAAVAISSALASSLITYQVMNERPAPTAPTPTSTSKQPPTHDAAPPTTHQQDPAVFPGSKFGPVLPGSKRGTLPDLRPQPRTLPGSKSAAPIFPPEELLPPATPSSP